MDTMDHNKETMTRVAGIDIGFRNTGVSIFDVDRGSMKLIDSECFRSKKVKGSKDYVAEQNAHSIREVLVPVVKFIRDYKVQMLVIELPTGGAKSSSAARALGIATCMAVALTMLAGCEYMYVAPRDVKIATTGDQYAEKNDIIKAMETKFPGILKHKKGKREHIADSIGCVIARLNAISEEDK